MEHARWNMRVTLSLRHGSEKVEGGRAIAEPLESEADTETLLDTHLIIGTPETCVRQVQRLKDEVGIEHLNCSFWFGDMQQDKILRSMELFAREVMPHFEPTVPAA